MTYAAPLKVTIRLTVYSKDPEDAEEERPRHQGAGSLLRRNSADDRQRHLHHQRHRARHRFAVAPLARRVLRARRRRRATSSARSFPTAEAGSSSSTTTRTCCTSVSTASANSTARSFCAPWASRPTSRFCARSIASASITIKDKKLYWNVYKDGEASPGLKLSHAINAKGGETVVGQGKKITVQPVQGNPEVQDRADVEVAPNDLEGAYIAADVVDMSTGEVLIDANSELTTTGILSKLMEAGIEEFEIFFPERDDVGTVISATIRKDSVKAQNEALIEIYRKLRPGDPPTLDTATQLFQGMFFDPRKYDFSRVGRMKFNIKLHDQADATPLDKRTLDPEDFRATIKYLLKLRKRHRRGGRYRSPRQPPRARRGRTARKPVPHRPGAHGARHQRKDVGLPGNVDGHAARPGERQAGHGGHPRILRIQPALAVHGSDQSALGDHPQAPSFGARTRRSVPRARRLRSPRRAPHALRPHLPHRDAGRSRTSV